MAPSTATNSEKIERELQRIDRFKKVAAFRANRALDYIEALLNTADRSRYMYTDKQSALIVDRLRQAIDQLEVAYSSKKSNRIEL